MSNVKSVEIVLENCEVIRFSKGEVNYFYLGEIKRRISGWGKYISPSLRSDTLFIELDSKANKYSRFITEWSDSDTPFERLMAHNDIVALHIYYDGGGDEHIYVNWDDSSQYENKYQTYKVSDKTGNLFIVVSEKENVGTVFKEV